MKYIIAAVLLIIWMTLTILLAVSVIGLLVIIDDESGWDMIPRRLLDVLSK